MLPAKLLMFLCGEPFWGVTDAWGETGKAGEIPVMLLQS